MYTRNSVSSVRGPSLAPSELHARSSPANVAAKDGQDVTVAIQVSTRGLDVSQPAGAQKLLLAPSACWRGWPARVGKPCRPGAPPQTRKVAVRRPLAGAIRAANLTLLTQVYLATHTLQESRGARDRACPVQMAGER